MPRTLRRRARQCMQPLDGRTVLIEGKSYIDFSRNDYLALGHDPRLTGWHKHYHPTMPTGSGGSAVVCGYRAEQERLEHALAQYLGYPKVLVLSNAFMANQAVLQTFIKRRQPILLDRLVHASIVESTRLSGGTLIRFRHTDIEHCEERLAKAKGPAWVITDGIFSMDGDKAPLKELSKLCVRYGATLMVDDAHGIGVVGTQGKGTVHEACLSVEQVPFLVGSFGKAFGGYGAFIASTEKNIESIISSARAYIYTTALPPYCILTAYNALQLLPRLDKDRAHLAKLIYQMKTIVNSQSDTPIQPMVYGSDSAAIEAHERLKAAGIWVPVIRPPTVPENTSRLRFSLNAAHRIEDINQVKQVLNLTGAALCQV